MGQTPHYFIAIPVTNELKSTFVTWQSELKEKLSYKVWPHQEDLHITLKFIGAVEEEQLIQLRKHLGAITHSEFSLSVGGIGTFGKHDSPRVLWAGVEKITALEELFKKVESAAITVGFSRENRPYSPHITLAKKWTGSSHHATVLQEVREHYKLETFQMDVDEFVLYQIFPSKSPKYERVESYRLKRG